MDDGSYPVVALTETIDHLPSDQPELHFIERSAATLGPGDLLNK